MRLEIRQLAVRLSSPFVSARGAVRERELLIVGLEAQDGSVGWGEAAPLEVPTDEVRAALETYRKVLAGVERAARAELLAACAQAAPLPVALSGLDLALWDLEGARTGEPVWRLLGASAPSPVQVNATIAAADRATAAAQAAAAARAGFRCLKVKVGLGDDAGRLAAVRAAAGPTTAIRLDANGAWTVPEARAALAALAPVGIELCEEPVQGLEAIAELAADAVVPVAIDETGDEPGVFTHRACSAICLKVSRCGGIAATVEAARQARACGYEVYLSSMLDGPLGIAAGLHVAAAIAPDRACGLATLALFADRADPLPPRRGAVEPPTSPGLGEGLVAWYG